MQAVRNNPFNRPNPFNFRPYQKFHHPQLPSSTSTNTINLVNSSNYQRTSALNNCWVFNQNNFNKKTDFSKKYEAGASKVSDFQVKMKMSSIYVPPNERSRVVQKKEGKLQNPFLRKNLLVNQEEVKNQVQIDINLYRQKAHSNYEPSKRYSIYERNERNENISFHQHQGRMSFGTLPNDNSGYRQNRASSNPYENPLVISQYMGQPLNNQSLVYSRTPVQTKRNPEDDNPSTLVFHAKRFFLNPVISE